MLIVYVCMYCRVFQRPSDQVLPGDGVPHRGAGVSYGDRRPGGLGPAVQHPLPTDVRGARQAGTAVRMAVLMLSCTWSGRDTTCFECVIDCAHFWLFRGARDETTAVHAYILHVPVIPPNAVAGLGCSGGGGWIVSGRSSAPLPFPCSACDRFGEEEPRAQDSSCACLPAFSRLVTNTGYFSAFFFAALNTALRT